MTSPIQSNRDAGPVWPCNLPHQLQLPDGSLWSNLLRSAQRHPDKTALVFYGTAITYEELRDSAESLAGYLQRHCGIGHGDRVVVRLHNSPQFVIAYHAILRAAAIVVPLSPAVGDAELEQIIEDCQAAVLITDQAVAGGTERASSIRHVIVARYADYLTSETDLPIPETIARAPLTEAAGCTPWQAALNSGARARPGLPTGQDFCVMPYTSGTTGAPKGCPHRHRNVMHTAVALALWHGRHADDVMLAALPLFHVTGMQNCMNTPLYLGATVILMARWDPEVAARLVQRHGVTCWSVVPTLLVDVLAQPAAETDLASLRMIGGGGATMPASLVQALHARTGLHYVEGYGLTETMAPTHINPHGRLKQSSLGIPIFDTDARIIDLETREVLSSNQTGEIVVHGPQVFDGYWNRDLDNRECFVTLGGRRFFRTGDLGYRDSEGYFFLVDRLKRMINLSGLKVWPTEVEATLHGHPAIRETVVVATPDPRRGEAVKAFVVLRDDTSDLPSEVQLIDWARERMARYKVPTQWEFLRALPKSPTGKVQWRALQEAEFQGPV